METNKYIQALARIKALLNDYYQNLGRGEFEDTAWKMKELIEDIDDIIKDVEIPQRFLVADKLRREKEETDNKTVRINKKKITGTIYDEGKSLVTLKLINKQIKDMLKKMDDEKTNINRGEIYKD